MNAFVRPDQPVRIDVRSEAAVPVTRERFDAVLFDLDGVLTDTASIHAACWKQVFDELLERRSKRCGKPFRPFAIETDYARYVDGKARLDGVRSFLTSRAIELAEGSESRQPVEDSVQAIGRRKDALFAGALAVGGAKVYEGSRCWLQQLLAAGLRTAVVSASHHCAEVLRAAGIEALFQARVDGQVADRLALVGKPAPDTFLEAAHRLGVAPSRAVVVEDALAGVQAGRAGGFGLVVGVARHGNRAALMSAGADVVVSGLEEMLQ